MYVITIVIFVRIGNNRDVISLPRILRYIKVGAEIIVLAK